MYHFVFFQYSIHIQISILLGLNTHYYSLSFTHLRISTCDHIQKLQWFRNPHCTVQYSITQ